MSTAVTMFRWRRSMEESDLPGTTKLVLHTLAGYTNKFGEDCWPALEKLAERAGIAVRTATKHLQLARAAGWLDSWKSRRPGRRWAHCHYRLRVPGDRLMEEYGDGGKAATCVNGEFEERGASNFEPDTEPRLAGRPDRSAAAPEVAERESYWHELPTKNPENRKIEKDSLSHTSEVYQGAVSERDEDFQESDAAELAAWMRDRVRAIDPEGDEPNLRSWACEIERMRGDDGRDERAIVRLFAWALRDKFWKRIITSPHRLRKHWAEVRRRRNAALEQPVSTTVAGATAPAVDDRLCAHVDANGVRCTHVATILGIGAARRGYCRHHVGYYED
ncbi:helix-turn-helix domain-containing protein [Burkholderia arboris]|uniref:helix-turn-helix domain-containing protein n=1 Tax=Burkholderia arboris TaxID=488730 RepID=UPI001CF279A6|nr:helix-turn-helix domain-containing protein [Burkholderia arboris]MCA8034876.1 helix-turn-helix domain-containing protein [Burkholderia arboris]